MEEQGKPLVKGAQNPIVKRAGSLLAVTRNKRNRIARVEQLDRGTRYVGPEGSTPRCTRLNTADWSRAMKKASAATKKLAFDLVDVYARRASAQGYAFGPDTPAQIEMEEAFPYRETPDQLAAMKADCRKMYEKYYSNEAYVATLTRLVNELTT